MRVVDQSTARCVLCRVSRPTSRGLVCESHHERLGQWLREIEAEAELLNPVKSMQVSTGNRGASLASERSPARLDVIVLRDPRRGIVTSLSEAQDVWALDQTPSILGALGSWARVVREERDLAPLDRMTIGSASKTLTMHWDWICEQPWVDEFAEDVQQLWASLKASNGTSPDKPHCRCPVVLGGAFCRGNVWVHDETQPVWRRYPDRCTRTWEKAPGPAVCDTCGSSWVTDGDKARLKKMVAYAAAERARPRTEDGRRMLTAQELVEQGVVSTAINVRVMAHRRGLVAVNGHYDPDDFMSKAVA